jgi:hypothetical protein
MPPFSEKIYKAIKMKKKRRRGERRNKRGKNIDK